MTSGTRGGARRSPPGYLPLLELGEPLGCDLVRRGEPLGVAPLLVEAYVGLGRLDDARSLTARCAEATPAAGPPLSIAFLHRCQAITAEDEVTPTADLQVS